MPLRWVAIISTVIVAFACGGPADGSCEDVLAALGKKPDTLEFVGCKERPDLQGAPSQARYRVAGVKAADVEAALAKTVALKALHRTCCIWESTENSSRDTAGRPLVIEMATEETTIDTREEWGKIPYFYVTVNRYREDP
jgi:Domian of unknown function (DUF4952)